VGDNNIMGGQHNGTVGLLYVIGKQRNRGSGKQRTVVVRTGREYKQQCQSGWNGL
jgi:hypothetical protein